MNGNHAIGNNVLSHIVALLFALADMADLAAVLSPRMRRILLDILRPGEAAGRRLVTRSDVGQADVPGHGEGYDPDDARRLAISLRALAMALQAGFGDVPCQARRFAGAPLEIDFGWMKPKARLMALRAPPFDTS